MFLVLRNVSQVSPLLLTLQVLDNATETVAMGSNQHPLSFFDLWHDLLVPERKCPSNGVLKTLTARELVLCQVSITSVLQGKRRSRCCQNSFSNAGLH